MPSAAVVGRALTIHEAEKVLAERGYVAPPPHYMGTAEEGGDHVQVFQCGKDFLAVHPDSTITDYVKQ